MYTHHKHISLGNFRGFTFVLFQNTVFKHTSDLLMFHKHVCLGKVVLEESNKNMKKLTI